jgi:ATP-dependent DNA helicase RecG
MLRFRIADLARDAELMERVPGLVANLDHAQADVLIERWIGDASQFADV